MSETAAETDIADAGEIAEDVDTDAEAEAPEVLEADEADVAEQLSEVPIDDEDYR